MKPYHKINTEKGYIIVDKKIKPKVGDLILSKNAYWEVTKENLELSSMHPKVVASSFPIGNKLGELHPLETNDPYIKGSAVTNYYGSQVYGIRDEAEYWAKEDMPDTNDITVNSLSNAYRKVYARGFDKSHQLAPYSEKDMIEFAK